MGACGQIFDARSPFVQAELLEARGLLALVARDPASAVRWHEQALALRTESFGPAHREVAKSLHNLANAHAEQGDLARAQQGLQRALSLYERVSGPQHPDVARVLLDLGDVQLDLDALDEAKASFERAMVIDQHAYGPQAPVLAGALLSLARVEVLRADPDLAFARARLERARVLQEANTELGPHHPDRAVRLELEGGLVIVETLPTPDHARALQAFAQATALWRRHDPTGPDALRSVSKELEMLYGLEDFALLAARVAVEGAPLRAHVARLGPGERGPLAWWIGDASLRAGHYAQAADYLALARDTYRQRADQAAVTELEADLARARRHLAPSPSSPTSPSPQGAPR